VSPCKLSQPHAWTDLQTCSHHRTGYLLSVTSSIQCSSCCGRQHQGESGTCRHVSSAGRRIASQTSVMLFAATWNSDTGAINGPRLRHGAPSCCWSQSDSCVWLHSAAQKGIIANESARVLSCRCRLARLTRYWQLEAYETPRVPPALSKIRRPQLRAGAQPCVRVPAVPQHLTTVHTCRK
jgi:hypothetical protein